MTKVAKQNRAKGRPKGSGHGYSVVMRIRKEFDKALELLDSRETPLHEILARELQEKPQDTLRAIGAFMPRQVDMQVNAEASYLDALKSVQAALNDQIDARTIDSDISATPIECDINATDAAEITDVDEID